MAARKSAVADIDDHSGQDRELNDAVILPGNPTPWLQVAQNDLGVHEIKGRRHNPRVVSMFATAGHPYVVDDETAWCAAAVCAWLEESGTASPKTLAARGFLRWGREIKEPQPGCVVVMWRGSPHGWQGHVGIYLGEAQGGRAIRVLGGNQKNKVSVAEFSKVRRYRGKEYDAVLAYRMPRRALRTQVAAVTSAVTTGSAAVGASVMAMQPKAVGPVANALVQTGEPTAVTIGKWLIVVAAIAGAGFAAYAALRRGADFKARGV